MIGEELEKKAEESYAKQLKDSSYYETGEEGAYICGYIAGAKELETKYMLKLKDTILVRALKDSIIMNEKLSSQEQQELCAWIEAAMEFGENLDECAKENEQLKAQIEKLNEEKQYETCPYRSTDMGCDYCDYRDRNLKDEWEENDR